MNQLKFRPALLIIAPVIIIFFSTFNSNGYAQFKIKNDEVYVIKNPHERFDFFLSKSRYNRVEGLFLDLGIKFDPIKVLGVNLIGEAGYGFSNQQWRYQVGLIKQSNELNITTISCFYFDETASLDDWVIGSWENSLAALFFKEDFKDYFGREGARISLSQKFLTDHKVGIELASYDYASMDRKTNWSIFGGNKKFQPNPSVTDGKENSLKLFAVLDWRDNPLYPINGWYVEAIYEKTRRDFKTDGLFLNLKRYQGTFMNQTCIIQAKVGTRKGSRAQQHLMDIGGVGSLKGYQDKQFSDVNRMLLFNIDYRFNQDILSRLPLKWLPFYNDLSLILFGDAGWARMVDPKKGLFRGFEKSEMTCFKSDLGISLSFSEDLARIDFARRTDRSNDTWRISFRLLPKL